MTEREGSYHFPDPRPWLRAAVPVSLVPGLDAWASWISDLVTLTDADWSQHDREQALEAFREGRMVRIPCGPQPSIHLKTHSGSEIVLASAWLEWAALAVNDRISNQAWESHIFPWARAAASAAGFKGSWRHPHIDAFVRCLVLMDRLDRLRLEEGESNVISASIREERRKAVWRECVHIRQSLADILPFAEDLPRTARGRFKYWWFSCLEWTRQAERQGDALWDGPVVLSGLVRAQITWQRWFGKVAFR
jgi:hypothetical protein